jgi:CubicO group peptidase (beta-lactamase class C family)
MRNSLSGGCLLPLLLCNLSHAADPVDEYLQAELQKGQLPGLAVAVTRGEAVVKVAGYGLADVENSIPVTPQTVFQIQSVTKQFVATAIMMLVEEGKIDPSAKVSDYLEGTPDAWKDISVRHLLSHTSGIKDFINEPTASLRLEVTDDEVFRATAARQLNFQPGEKYAYSNSNYHLLAMIIRKLTGEPYPVFLKKRIFDPLGMGHTRVMSWADIVPHRAAGYGRQGAQLRHGQFVAESILAYGGGGLLSTPEDMAKWALALRGEKLLKRSSFDQMWAPNSLGDGTQSPYGFGWGIGGQTPHRFVQHSGGHITGFTSHIIRYLDDDLAVVVLVNAGYADPSKLARRVAGLYVPALSPPMRKPIADHEPAVTELLRRTERMIRQQRLDDGVFTPALESALAKSLPQSAEELNAIGLLNAVELLERTDSSNGMRQYLYRMRFARATLIVTVVLDRDGKVAGLSHEQE